MTEDQHKPRGREEVTQALIEAAAELFSKYGVEGVSVRDVAARADVNHGLIHRHFGSKENLRLKTQEYLAARVREAIGFPTSYQEALDKGFHALRTQDAFWRVLARTFLDGEFHGDVQSDFPFIRNLVDLARLSQDNKEIRDDIDPRYLVAGAVAFGLGMLVFEGFVLPASGLHDEEAEDVQKKVNEFFFSLIKPDA